MRRPKRLFFRKVTRQPQVTIELDTRPVLYLVDAITGAAKAIGRALQPISNTFRGMHPPSLSPELLAYLQGKPLEMQISLDAPTAAALLQAFDAESSSII